MRKLTLSLSLAALSILSLEADNIKDVNGKYSFIVEENDNITLKEAKHKTIELAKAQAIKDEFGEFITSDIISTTAETEDDLRSYFWENTVAMAKGDWLADTKTPEINIEYIDNHLVFTAEVWGKAREIKQANADLSWKIQKPINDKKTETTEFENGERIFVNFKSPADGYVAIYLIEGDDQTSCLLPYRKDPTGKVPIKNGKEYNFFDKTIDPSASNYKMSTDKPEDFNQLVIIYSPNPFTKCNDITGDAKHPNSLSTSDFQKWLLKCQRADSEMVVNKKWIKIRNKEA